MATISTLNRSNEAEIMDDFELKGDELENTLKDLDNINKWLGGNKITLNGIKKLLKNHDPKIPVHIVDVGCGNGAILREIASWGRSKNFSLKLTGIDANTYAIEIAERLSAYYPEISYSAIDIFSETFKKQKFDILLCTLTLHHFKNPQVTYLTSLFTEMATIGVVINDLHRSKAAYRLFQAFCRVFIDNEIARKDGLISILRGFKKNDLKQISANINAQHEINWKWAFRYQWIIQK